MKRTRGFALLVTFAIAFMFTGCGRDGGPVDPMGGGNTPPGSGDSTLPSELVATWTFQSLQMMDTPLDLAFFMEWEEETATARVQICPDGSITYRELDENDELVCSLHGTMEVDGDQFSYEIIEEFEGENIEKTASGTWAVDGNQLSLTVVQDEMPLVFILTK